LWMDFLYKGHGDGVKLLDIAQYEEKVYAGVLGKIIGVYLGRPVEGWPYEEIQKRFGEVDNYVHSELDEPLIVADDDISGTFAFFRAVSDNDVIPPTAQQVGHTWLNYIIEKRTILWWGGVGRSTEHTAFFHLTEGVDAPDSGSSRLNGPVLPEQVGAQIFYDAFAMIYPGDPERAAHAVREAASVSHDGVAVDAASFLGAMRALAFGESSLSTLIADCRQYVRTSKLNEVIDGVIEICSTSESWRAARDRIDGEYGYAKYPGPCHIVPNHAMTLGALLLGGDNFRRSVMIAASAGLDTDSNAGTVGCLNGIRLGLDALTEDADLRKPVADRLLVVTADGGSCVSDAESEAKVIVREMARARGNPLPDPGARFSFSYRGSTQGFQPCPYRGPQSSRVEVFGGNGRNGLTVECEGIGPDTPAAVSVPVFLDPLDDARNFSTVASPTLYPGQTVFCRVHSDSEGLPRARLYVLYLEADGTQRRKFSEPVTLGPQSCLIEWKIPPIGSVPLVRLGLLLEASGSFDGRVTIEKVDWRGAPSEFEVSGSLMTSIWETQPIGLRGWVSSAENFEADSRYTFALSHSHDLGLATLGARDWSDYSVTSHLAFSVHTACGLVLRSVGHRRFYAAMFEEGKRLTIVKHRDRNRTVLAAVDFPYEVDEDHLVTARCVGRDLVVDVDGVEVISTRDADSPYLGGAAGLIVEGGTVYADGFSVHRLGDGVAGRDPNAI
jgi:ADP-ribosylglycohydrolase